MNLLKRVGAVLMLTVFTIAMVEPDDLEEDDHVLPQPKIERGL